jgi:hypothetical protein
MLYNLSIDRLTTDDDRHPRARFSPDDNIDKAIAELIRQISIVIDDVGRLLLDAHLLSNQGQGSCRLAYAPAARSWIPT